MNGVISRQSITVNAALLGNFPLSSDQERLLVNNTDDGCLTVNQGFHMCTSGLAKERCYTVILKRA